MSSHGRAREVDCDAEAIPLQLCERLRKNGGVPQATTTERQSWTATSSPN